MIRAETWSGNVAAPPVASAHERGLEAQALLQAVVGLYREGILTTAEYQAKRQQLAAWL